MSRRSVLFGASGVATTLVTPATINNTNPAVPAITINPAAGQMPPLLQVNGDIDTPNNVNVGTTVSAGELRTGGNVLLYGNTPATALANVTFGDVIISGNYWTGAVSAADAWTFAQTLAVGSNPLSTLTVTGAGSSGGHVLNFVCDQLQFNGNDLSGELTVRLTLTSAQILSIGTVPVQILPALGGTLAYRIIRAYAHYRFNTTAYTLGAMTAFYLLGNPGTNPLSDISVSGLIDQAHDTIFSDVRFTAPSVVYANNPIFVEGDASPTLGLGTVTFTLEYIIIDESLT